MLSKRYGGASGGASDPGVFLDLPSAWQRISLWDIIAMPSTPFGEVCTKATYGWSLRSVRLSYDVAFTDESYSRRTPGSISLTESMDTPNCEHINWIDDHASMSLRCDVACKAEGAALNSRQVLSA